MKASENGYSLHLETLITISNLLISDCRTTDSDDIRAIHADILDSDADALDSSDAIVQGDFTNGYRFSIHSQGSDKSP